MRIQHASHWDRLAHVCSHRCSSIWSIHLQPRWRLRPAKMLHVHLLRGYLLLHMVVTLVVILARHWYVVLLQLLILCFNLENEFENNQ